MTTRQPSIFLATCFLAFAAVVSHPITTAAQSLSITEPHPIPVGESQEKPCEVPPLESSPCSVSGFFRNTWNEARQFGYGLKSVPRGSIQPKNLKWELPILAATGVLIARVDRPAADRIQSKSLQHTAELWSNVGLGVEIGSGAFAYGLGCMKHRTYMHDSGFKGLAAMGAAGAVTLALELAFDRQFPFTPGSTGKFWGGGRSFPSGHSATSFAFAALIAHRYPHNKWIKWSAYTLATGVALSRYPAKQHYPSDILVGSTVGYVAGTYLAQH